eukprot:403344657
MKVIRIDEIEQLEQYLMEIDIMSKINNPYINKLIDYYFQEDIESGQEELVIIQPLAMYDLQQFLDEHYPQGQMAENEAIEYLAQLVVAIKAMHDKDVIHRDLNPKNILMSKNDIKTTLNDQDLILKIADFGCSKILDPHKYQANTLTGKISYMAPEQLNNSDKGYNSKVDIYALGLTVFQMITGEVLNSGDIDSRKANVHQYSPQFIDLLYQLCSLDHTERPTIDQIIQNPIIQKSHTFINCLVNDILPVISPTIEGVIAYLKNMELPKEYEPLAESLGDELQKKMPFFEERLQKPLKNTRQYSAGDYTMPQEFEEAIGNNDEKYFMTKLQQMAQQDNYLQSLDILKDCRFRREVNKYGEIFVGIYKQDSIEGFSQAKSYSKFYGRYYSQDYVIEGFFKNGNFEGEGYEYGLNTERINYYFDGEFLKSKSNGIGTTIYIEGDMYYGQFKNGKRNGLGTYYWDYGDVFEGQWRDHYKNGEGVLKYANGDIIRGPWKDDYIQGEHVLTYVDGKLEKIIFEMGKEISSEEIIIP